MTEHILIEAVHPLGVFAMMATMSAIIAGGTGIRLLFIEKVYRHITMSILNESKLDNPNDDNLSRLLILYQKISDIRSKRESNRRGVKIDGSCVTIIFGMGFVTAFGFNPNLPVSVVIVFLVFLGAMLHFHRHVQTALNSSV